MWYSIPHIPILLFSGRKKKAAPPPPPVTCSSNSSSIINVEKPSPVVASQPAIIQKGKDKDYAKNSTLSARTSSISKSSINLRAHKNGGVNETVFNSKFSKRIPFFNKFFANGASTPKLIKSKSTVTLGQIYNKDDDYVMVQERSVGSELHSNIENDDSTENSDTDVINILTISGDSYSISYINECDSIIGSSNENITISTYDSKTVNVNETYQAENVAINTVTDNSRTVTKNNDTTDSEVNKVLNTSGSIKLVPNLNYSSTSRINEISNVTPFNSLNIPSNNFNISYVKDSPKIACSKSINNDDSKIPENTSNISTLEFENELQKIDDNKTQNHKFAENNVISSNDISKDTMLNERETSNDTDCESVNNNLDVLTTTQKESPLKLKNTISVESSVPSNNTISRKRDDENWKQFLSKLDKIIVSKSSEFL